MMGMQVVTKGDRPVALVDVTYPVPGGEPDEHPDHDEGDQAGGGGEDGGVGEVQGKRVRVHGGEERVPVLRRGDGEGVIGAGAGATNF